jgi:DNA-binding transcriptional LysR family regulator
MDPAITDPPPGRSGSALPEADSGIEVRHLRTVVAIAEHGSLTGAAAALGLGQPGVSRALAQVEARLGVRLVQRTTRSTELTPAGEAFREAAVRALVAIADAATAARGRTPPLRWGFSWSAAGRHTLPVLHEWRRRYPDRPVEVRRSDDRTAGLATGEADVAVVRVRLEAARYARSELFRERRCVAVADADPLAGRAELRLADLAGRPLAIASSYGTTTTALWPPGRRPVVTVDVRTIDDWLAVIGSGQAIGVTAESTAHQHPLPGITYVPVVDAPPIVVWLAWRRDRVHPWQRAFLQVARQVVRGGAAAATPRVTPSGETTSRVTRRG